jgi:hypothetical protein
MSGSVEYQKFAEECRRLVRTAETEEQPEILLDLAKHI